MSLRTASDPAVLAALERADKTVVQIDHVSVRYRVPHERIGTFKEYAIRRLQGRISYSEFWALRDVTLCVSRREVLGIVGRNGAGKTTLLKIIARVLRPTQGRVVVRGHVAPLLDLGAGFHPELTGRENVYLNGSLLGHTQREIRERFAEILEFAELHDFVDAPLRTYSSGMVARLGFAVATAWPPDILILDEVLAVGDEAFQQKCRTRLEDFRNKGTTVLLVSHSAELIRTMCRKAIWLDQGAIRMWGLADDVLGQYHALAVASS